MVNLKNNSTFFVNGYKLNIADNGKVIYFYKKKKVDLDEFIECTKPIVRYLHAEGFITESRVKVAILSNK